ncbi:hypothetical protein D3C84_759450 [compost metagenome]
MHLGGGGADQHVRREHLGDGAIGQVRRAVDDHQVIVVADGVDAGAQHQVRRVGQIQLVHFLVDALQLLIGGDQVPGQQVGWMA